MQPHVLRFLFATAALIVFAGCDQNSEEGPIWDPSSCNFPAENVVSGGVPQDGIPSLENPLLVPSNDQGAAYLDEDSRVVGVLLGTVAVAVPHNILWWHEIVNLDVGGEQVAISYCPLTGSSLAFDRVPFGGGTFGVSGLLYQNNLIMYNRGEEVASLWPQLLRQAGCGPRIDTPLPQITAFDISWSAWKELYPSTFVVSDQTGHARNYTRFGFPYGDYEELHNVDLLFPQTINTDRPAKERGVGIPSGTGGRLYPFLELAAAGDSVAAVNDIFEGRSVGVFWRTDAAGATVFNRELNGTVYSFEVMGDEFRDMETGSTWNMAGRAIDGPLEGAQLSPIEEAYVAFWFAWKAFQPNLEVWTAND